MAMNRSSAPLIPESEECLDDDFFFSSSIIVKKKLKNCIFSLGYIIEYAFDVH